MKFLVGIILGFLIINQLSAQQKLESLNQRHFIDWLYVHNEADEYEKTVKNYLEEFPKDKDEKIRLIKYYSEARKVDSCYKYLNAYFNNEELLHHQRLFELKLKLLIQMHKISELDTIIAKKDWPSAINKDVYVLTSYLLKDKFKESQGLYHDLILKNSELIMFEKVINLSYFRPKRPIMAGAMGLIPGLGKLYCKRKKDAFTSFLLVSVLSWQGYVGFRNRGYKSIFGYINGGAAISFYFSGIYGSYKAAKKYNKQMVDEIHENTIFLHQPIY